MSRLVLLDTGPLGQLARRRPDPAIVAWTHRLSATARLIILEICDYELRRELMRARLITSVQTLDDLATVFDYLPIDTTAMRLAADLWSQMRQQGTPTAGSKDLDGDVILAAHTQLLRDAGHDAIVATANVGHLTRLVPAHLWHTII